MADSTGFDAAFSALSRGDVVAIPTETVYGLAADATDPLAVAKVFEIKQRPHLNPLIAHFHSLRAASREVEFNPLSLKLADAFWPGPLTLVLPITGAGKVCGLARAGLDTLAVRIPAHPVALELLAVFGRPLVAPSANPSGRLSPTSATHVREGFNNRVPVLDGGPAENGLESTILRVVNGRVVRLRAGAIPDEDITKMIGRLDEPDESGPVRAPGMAFRHYAPKVALRLNVTDRNSTENHLGFGPEALPCTFNLSPSGSLLEAAANLFDMLHRLEAMGQPVAVSPIPLAGLGLAINDRLIRAAASVALRNN